MVVFDGGRDKHSDYPAYTEATVQATAETQRHRQPHGRPEHHQDNHHAPEEQDELEYPQHSKYRNSWADHGMKWVKECRGTCQAGRCHVNPYDGEQCVGGY
jgi:hypothetical protein